MSDIFIIKDDNRTSQLTFTVRISAVTRNGTGFATMPGDFELELIEEFKPDEDRLNVHFKLDADGIPEGDETFQLEITNGGSVPFDTSITTTTVTILENDGERER